MRCHHPIFQPLHKELLRLLPRLTLKNKQILDRKLLILIPSQPQPLRRIGRIEQIINPFIIYLQKRHRDREAPARTLPHLAKHILQRPGYDPVHLLALHRMSLA